MMDRISRLRSLPLLVAACFLSLGVNAQKNVKVPSVYSNIDSDKQGVFLVTKEGLKVYAVPEISHYPVTQYPSFAGNPEGLLVDFKTTKLQGTLYYGFIPQGDSKFPHPVLMGKSAPIKDGKSSIKLVEMMGRFDMIGWRKSNYGTIGYRVVDEKFGIIHDGKINFDATKFNGSYGMTTRGAMGIENPVRTEAFIVGTSIIEGPILANLTSTGVTVVCRTNAKTKVTIRVDGKAFSGKNVQFHEIAIDGLQPDTEYAYRIFYGKNFVEEYSFRTAPSPGSRTAFTFSYASDSRSGPGGGERNLGGTNAYIMDRIMALNMQQQARFMQFSGDLITGLRYDPVNVRLEYINWKQAISPYARYMPVIPTMGNHEALLRGFYEGSSRQLFQVDNFPFETNSSEAIYREEFVAPLNGPESEDGSKYDPDPNNIDFPSYKESAFHYIYDNVGMLVLNSNYWYAPTVEEVPWTSGNIHGYVMDNQLAWAKEALAVLENDPNVDHIFVTLHTPFFPNGGHVHDDMWYNGDNSFRPYVAGKPVEKGIIERRDELLDLFINNSTKVKAFLTGDEHNYARTRVGPQTPIYPRRYEPQKIQLTREVWQINNGAAGAPYYAQEETPWTEFVEGFTTQNALVFFHVDGDNLRMEVLNPVTLEKVDELVFSE